MSPCRLSAWWPLAAVLLLAGSPGSSAGPDPGPEVDRSLQNYVYFGLERDRIREASFLETPTIVGAQLKYTWRELEPERDLYELGPVIADLEFLEHHGKRLFIQLQDVSFSTEIVNVPQYLREDPAFGGGADLQYSDDGSEPTPEGWVARRWDPAVRERFINLLKALGSKLDGRIEGLNLPETSIGFRENAALFPDGFSNESYAEGVKIIMGAAREAFPRSHVIQYANFMPGEWLPWTEKGYLKGIYEHAARIGVGVGGPDLMPHRKGQQNHCLVLIEARGPTVVAGLVVQWGNLEQKNSTTGKRVSVPELYEYGRERLRLDYIFWGTQEPYYSEEVIPYLRALEKPRER